MAAVGFAVGIGNIWRFPYVTGENGGGAFVLVYLCCAVGIGIPILVAELLLGRRGQASPPRAVRNVALAEGRSARWGLLGAFNVLAGFAILVTYATVVGWVLWYLFKALTQGFTGFDAISAGATFDAVLADAGGLLLWTLVAIGLAGAIVFGGVNDGIERSVRVLMPLLFALLASMAVYNLFVGGMGEALDYLFTPDFSKLSGTMVLAAIGQAFFSIGVAMGGMMAFGSYLPRDVSIVGSVLMVIIADTLVALTAGLAIFPAVFHYGLDPADGPGLIFQTLPVAFANMPGGSLVALAFFLLLSVGGITTIVGFMEPITAWCDERFGWSRHRATLTLMGLLTLTSVPVVLSYNLISHWQFAGRTFNDWLDFVSAQIMLPLGGLLIAVFVGWFVSRGSSADELAPVGAGTLAAWRFAIRFLVPPAVALILVTGLL